MTRWPTYPVLKDSGVPWLGEIPAHWKTMPLKYACLESALYGANLSASEYVNEGVRFLRTTDIDDDGHLMSENAVFVERSLVQDYLLKDGDLLLSRSGTIGRSFIFEQHLHGECAYAGYLVAFRLRDALFPRFVFYFTKSKQFEEWLSLSVISSTIGNVNGQKYANMPLPFPSLAEQRAIAAFLDQEMARIDALAAQHERLIALLEEHRAALIARAVTQGLDPAAPRKESGIAWLGEIPSHWEELQLRQVVDKFVDYRGKTPEKVDSGIPLITARNIKNGQIDFDLSQEFIREEDYDGWMVRGLPEVGDVLVTTEAPLGACAQIVDTRIALAQRIILLKANRAKIENDYLKYYLTSNAGQGELWTRATGSTAVGIKASHLRAITVLVPPLSEQRAIAAYLDRETARIDALIGKARAAQARLAEYRAAVITAVVTGKIDATHFPKCVASESLIGENLEVSAMPGA